MGLGCQGYHLTTPELNSGLRVLIVTLGWLTPSPNFLKPFLPGKIFSFSQSSQSWLISSSATLCVLSYRVSCSLLQKFVWRAEVREAQGAVVLMFLEMTTLTPVVRTRLILIAVCAAPNPHFYAVQCQ